jgi:hypothetical protein
MGRYSDEQKQQSLRRARELLEQLDAEDAAGAAEAEAESSYSPEPNPMQSFGRLPLLSCAQADRVCAAAAAFQRERERAIAARKAEEARIIREHQQAAERASMREMAEQWTEVLGEVIAEERQRMRDCVTEQIGQLRGELAVQRAAEVIDLPPMQWKRHSTA